MSKEDPVERARRIMFGDAAGMSTERPLDALLAGLKQKPVMPLTPFHQRVLQVETDEGLEWIIACWKDPGSAREFHKQLLALLEAAILLELSVAPKRIADRERPRPIAGVRLMVFATLPYAVEPAVAAFAFEKRAFVASELTLRMQVLADEAMATGAELPAEPTWMGFARVQMPTGRTGENLLLMERNAAQALRGTVWGEHPGMHSRTWAELAKETFGADVRPSLDGLTNMEVLLRSNAAGVIRWVPPLAFQSMCDLIGVTAGLELDAKVAWALCEEDESGLAAPPLFKVTPKQGRAYHIPIAHHVLRWMMMPIAAGEEVPPMSEWMKHQFGE